MNVTINGVRKSFQAPLNIKDALAQEGYDGMMVAVARNGTFVAKMNYANTTIENGDDIEIVAPMQGG